MNFDKKFPSLVGKGCTSFESDNDDDCCVDMEENYYSEDDVYKNCLDKNVVKKALDEFFKDSISKGASIDELKKKLGLEKYTKI